MNQLLDKIIHYSIKNKVLIALMTLALALWGIWSMTRIDIDAVPDITNNQVQVITTCPSLATQEVEQLVTSAIEQNLGNLPDLVELRSISRFGLSVITVVFEESMDVYLARQLINERLLEVAKKLPRGVEEPELAPVSTGLGEIYQYIIQPKEGAERKYSLQDLRSMQDWIVARQLIGTKGVAEINSFGGKVKQYEVAIDPNRLRAMGISLGEIFEALEKGNQNTGGAYIDKKPNAYFIRSVGMINSLEDVGKICLRKHEGEAPLLIRDVAELRMGSAIRYGALTYNGTSETVGGIVMMLKGENSHDVAQRIKSKLPQIQNSLPEDIELIPYLDRTELVGRAISTVEKNLIEGALIVIFVLVLFLGNFRAGLIVASAIPLSLLFALGMMEAFGISANLMSLGAIDFGLIVDGAVIVVEASLHHLAQRKGQQGLLSQEEMDEEVYQSASKIRSSATFGEIIILIVYIPILTLVGIEGKMFIPMALAVSFAIIGALILSLTYIPMMCAIFLKNSYQSSISFSERLMNKAKSWYAPLLKKALGKPYAILITTIILFVCSLIGFSRLGGEFIPQLQEGDFAFHCILPEGTSLSQSIETSMQASRIIKSFDEVKMVIGKTGSAEVPTDPMPPEATDLMIMLKDPSEWSNPSKTYEELGEEMLEALGAIPGVFFEKNQPIQMRFNELMTGVRQDVAVKIFGENLDSLSSCAEQISEILNTIEGVANPQLERVKGLPQININYNRLRLASYGVSIEDANTAVNTAFAGQSAGEVYEDERRFDLVLRLKENNRSDIEDVRNLPIQNDEGLLIPLGAVAKINYKPGPAQISREEGKRRIVIGFNVRGRDVETIINELDQKIQSLRLPTGYYITYGGQFENLQRAKQRLFIAVPISLLLIFLLLFVTFHSFRWAMLIFTAIPMSAIGGVAALWLRSMPFSISAGVGFIALFGVAVLNGIVLIGTFCQMEQEEIPLIERILRGTEERLRPVLMTAMVASLGFLPMAISQGAGAEVQRPLATVVIGGLVSATFLTLFVLPILYSIFAKDKDETNKAK